MTFTSIYAQIVTVIQTDYKNRDIGRDNISKRRGQRAVLAILSLPKKFCAINNNKSKPRVTKNRRVLTTVLLHLQSINVIFEIFQQEINEALVVVSYSAK